MVETYNNNKICKPSALLAWPQKLKYVKKAFKWSWPMKVDLENGFLGSHARPL